MSCATGLHAENLIDSLTPEPHVYPCLRLNHARGIILMGHFSASQEGRAASSAKFLQASRVRAIVRFSSTTGLPDVAENDPVSSPKGIGIRLFNAHGNVVDFVGHSTEMFPATTAANFLEFLNAVRARASSPELLEAYLARNPLARRYLETKFSMPRSFELERYHMLHAYKLTGSSGKTRTGRIFVEPLSRPEYFSQREMVNQGSAFLTDRLTDTIKWGAVKMLLCLKIAAIDDDPSDISLPWPEDRERITLGTLTLTRPETVETDESLSYNPANLCNGIEPYGDEMWDARCASYNIASRRRKQASR